VSGWVTTFLNFSLQTKSTHGHAAIGNIEPDTSPCIAPEDGAPSPENSAGANEACSASFQEHDQCRRELCLRHPCGQVPS
jgi:hypothetical protein